MPMEESQNYTLSLHDALPIWGRLKSAFDTVATAPVPQELRTAVHPPQAEVVDFGRALPSRNPRLRLAADARQCAALGEPEQWPPYQTRSSASPRSEERRVGKECSSDSPPSA